MKVGLGTVQFGMDYGISNKDGQTSPDECAKILNTAWAHGIQVIDTATLYGSSEEVIGRNLPPSSEFKIVTKTPSIGLDEILLQHLTEVESTFNESLSKLKQTDVYGLLAHNANDLLVRNGQKLFRCMENLKESGRVSKIGVSAYSPQQVDAILDRFPIDLIQVPINILDQRLISGGQLSKLKECGVEVHARSAFLQGLLLMPLSSVSDYFSTISPLIARYHQVIFEAGITPIQAAISFLAQNPYIDVIVCGVNNSKQLVEICEAATITTAIDFSQFEVSDESIINPSRWKSATRSINAK